MLSCNACMRHCIQTIVGDSAIISATSRTARFSNQPLRRTVVTTSYQRALDKREEDSEAQRKPGNRVPRDKWIKSRGVRPQTIKRKPLDPASREVAIELKYLKDPVKLATYVREKLRDDDFATAQTLVRSASKDTQCTVSWNHLVDYQLSRGMMNAAIKTYNEMKKRAQAPDAQTYTIIFRGCAQHNEPENALNKVLSIYQSMLTEKAPIKPNVIHMNAVLKMCARAQNMDALMAVMDQMPERGIRAANNLSFTTILNALRMYAVNNLGGTLTPMQVRQGRQKFILIARQMWVEVIKRWQKGDIMVDEELVAAMGRLLLVGNEQDVDDVLSLIEQTMNIPRQIPRMGTIERLGKDPSGQGSIQSKQHILEARSGEFGEEPETTEDSFQSLAETNDSPAKAGVYVKPGANTISLVMKALEAPHLKDVATNYWNILTKSLNIAPDSDNYHCYLRILRLARASTEVVKLLLEMPDGMVQAKTVRIAMSTCQRDKKNRHAFANAGKILDLMQTKLKEPDLPSLENYLDVAITAPVYDSTGQMSKSGQGAQIMRALHRINPSYINIKSYLLFAESSISQRTVPDKVAFRESAYRIVTQMIRSYDLMINNALVPKEEFAELHSQRRKLGSFVTRYKNTLEEREKMRIQYLAKKQADADKNRPPVKPAAPAKSVYESEVEETPLAEIDIEALKAETTAAEAQV